MIQSIKEPVAVLVVYDPAWAHPRPVRLRWKDRRYAIKTIGLCHPSWEGKTLHHIYSVSTDNLALRLDFNTQNQIWTLQEISDGLAD